jgi:hypothetical protein
MPARRRLLPLLAALALGACALPGPPWLPPPSPPAAALDTAPALRAVEGQPRGLLLQLSINIQENPPESLTLIRQRQRPGEAPGAFSQRALFEPQRHAALWRGEAVQLLDGDLEPEASYRYLLVAVRGGALAERSAPLALTWVEPPASPLEVEAEAVGEHALLRWRGSPTQGAQIFRRALGQRSYERVGAPLPEGARDFSERPPGEGAAWGYLVCAVVWRDGVPRIGPPGPEVIVATQPGEDGVPLP